MLDTISARTVLLSGAGTGEAARGLLLALASVGGRPCVVAAHNAASGLLTGPGDLRAARRGMRLAAELHIPLLTIVDTAGAELSAAAEEGGLAAEIARCLADLMSIHSPTLSVLLGQGGGGSALALLPWPIAPSRRAVPGSPRSLPRAAAPWSTATSRTRPTSPTASTSPAPTCWPRGRLTGW